MGAATEPRQIQWLGLALGGLGERLPVAQAEAGALLLVEVMGATKTSRTFFALAKALGALSVPGDLLAMVSATDLLQAPMAVGETRAQLLHYYSRLAGVFGTADEFASMDDLLAWMRKHNPNVNLTRPPRNPFR